MSGGIGHANPADILRAFSAAWGERAADHIADLCCEDADFISLTGAHAEGRQAINDVLSGEFSGALAQARLVSGRAKLRPLGHDHALAVQHFIVSGAVDEQGQEIERISIVLMATLCAQDGLWQAASLQMSALERLNQLCSKARAASRAAGVI